METTKDKTNLLQKCKRRTRIKTLIVIVCIIILLTEMFFDFWGPEGLVFWGKAKSKTVQSVAEFIASEIVEYPPDYASHITEDSVLLAKSGLIPLSSFMIVSAKRKQVGRSFTYLYYSFSHNKLCSKDYAKLCTEKEMDRILKVWMYEKGTLRSATKNDFKDYEAKENEIHSAMEPYGYSYVGLYGDCSFSVYPMLGIGNSIVGVFLDIHYGPLGGGSYYYLLKRSGNKWKTIKERTLRFY